MPPSPGILYPAEGEAVTNAIRQRRSIYANDYNGRDIAPTLLEEILTNATWAPTHKMTEPWRFIVLKQTQLTLLGQYMADYYQEYYRGRMSEQDALQKYKYLQSYPAKAACVVGIVLQRHAASGLPEWEEIAAVSCAVQNMALTATAYDIASYWDSGGATLAYFQSLGLAEHEQSLGALFLGYVDEGYAAGKKRRTAGAVKVSWLS